MEAYIYLDTGINWNNIEIIDCLTKEILVSERYHKWKEKNGKRKCIKRVIKMLDSQYNIINRDVTFIGTVPIFE
jgi:hypothetical protein